MPDLLGFKSSDIGKNYRNLIQISNSLSIVFMQYDLNDVALLLLKHSSDADTKLHRFGSYQDKLWDGSLLTYNNLILLFHKVKHYKESLKLVFQAQNFLLTLKRNNSKVLPDLEITTHILSFISLWKVGRASECVSYIQSATDILNDMIEQRVQTKLSENGLDNLYGLISCSLAAVKVVVEKNKAEAFEIIKKAQADVNRNAGCRVLLENLSEFFEQNNDIKIVEDDWLYTKIFEKIMVLTCFVPLIDHRTPIIKAEELESVKGHLNGKFEEEPRKKERTKKLEERSWKWENKSRMKPWWENKSFFSNGRGKEPSFASEPRRQRGRVSGSLDVPKGLLYSEMSLDGRLGRDESYYNV